MANKLSIKSLLEKRAEIPFSRQSNDWWVNQIIEYNSDVVYFVTTFGMSGSNNIQDMYLNPVHHLNRSDVIRDILLKYYEITAVFGLSNSMKYF